MTARYSLLLTALSLGALSPAAHAGAKGGEADHASREYVVEPPGGAFEVPLSPSFVTVFYLPEDVVQALASDQKGFSITIRKGTVAVRPVVGKRGSAANLAIDTTTLHLSIILRVGDDEDAVSQVIFTRGSERRELERRVAQAAEDRIAPLRRQYEAKLDALDAEVARSTEGAIARRILDRFAERPLRGIARTEGNVVVRVERAVWAGVRVYVVFEVQNRGEAPFRVERAALLRDGIDIAALSLFEPRAKVGQSGHSLGTVAGGRRGRGVLVAPAGRAAGRPLTLEMGDAAGKRVEIGGLRIEPPAD